MKVDEIEFNKEWKNKRKGQEEARSNNEMEDGRMILSHI